MDPNGRYGLRLTLFAVAFLIVAVPFGLLLEQVLSDGPLTRLDLRLSEQLIVLARDYQWANSALEGVSFLGKPIFLFPLVGLPALWLLRKGEPRLAIYLALTSITGGLVDTVIKVLVARPRPRFDGEPLNEAFGHSFPSGHSMASVVCYGALLLVLLPYIDRRWRRMAMLATSVVVLAIGLSRLGLGVHYTSDVIGGYVLGLAWLMLSTAAFSIWRVERGRTPLAATAEGIGPEENPALVATHRAADAH